MQNADSQGEYVPTLQHFFFCCILLSRFSIQETPSLSLSLSDRSCCSSFSVCRSFSMVCCRAARSSCHRFRLLCFQSSFWKARSPVPVPVSRFPPCRLLQRWVFTLATVFQAEEGLCPSGLWQPLLPGLVDVCWSIRTMLPLWCLHEPVSLLLLVPVSSAPLVHWGSLFLSQGLLHQLHVKLLQMEVHLLHLFSLCRLGLLAGSSCLASSLVDWSLVCVCVLITLAG